MKTSSRFLSLQLLSLVLTLVTSVFGAPVQRVIHKVFGSRWYWLSNLAIALVVGLAGVPHLAILLIGVATVSGIFWELEKRGRSWQVAGITALIVTSCLVMGLGFLWVSTYQVNLQGEIKNQVLAILSALKISKEKVQFEELMWQIPSVTVILLILNLAIALLFDKKMAVLVRIPVYLVSFPVSSTNYRMPDLFIWLTMVAFLFSFLKIKPDWIPLLALNVFNVAVVLYFFQGLAIVESFFEKTRVTGIWRSVLYLILVLQLFLVTSFLGFIDYWVDFRKRIKQIKPLAS